MFHPQPRITYRRRRSSVFYYLCLAGVCMAMLSSALLAANQRTKLYAGHKVSFFAHDSHSGAVKALARWFQDETGAVVEVTTIHYGDVLERVLQDNASKQPKADVYMNWYVDLGRLVERQAIAEIGDLIDANRQLLDPDDFIPALYDTYTLYRGRRWGLPFDGDTHLLFYRKSLLAKYSLKPPETWSDYLQVAKTITENERRNGIYGSAIMAYPTPILIVSCFMNRLGSYGGQLMDENNSPSIESPEALAALTDMMAQSAYALPTITETDFATARDAFLTGQVAMVEHWSDIGIMAGDISQSLIRNDWGVIQMPRGRGANAKHAPALNAGFFLSLSSKAPHPEVAKAFLVFASRPDIGLKLNLINGGVDPIRKSILNAKAFKQFAPAVSQVEKSILYNATAWPVVPQTPKLLTALTAHLVDALEGRKTAAQALKDAQHQWRQILKTE